MKGPFSPETPLSLSWCYTELGQGEGFRVFHMLECA